MHTDIPSKVTDFFSQFPQRQYEKGESIVFADGVVPPVTYLVEGKVCQYDIAENGSKVILNVFGPGSFFPMSNAMTGRPGSHFFEAISVVTVHQAPPTDAVQFVRDNPDVLFDLTVRLYRGVDGLLDKLMQLMSGTAQARLLQELTMMAERFGESLPDGTYRIKVTETQLAQQTGLARETISRELQKLKQQALITTSKQGICVRVQTADFM